MRALARPQLVVLAVLLVLLPSVSCSAPWEATVIRPDGTAVKVDGNALQGLGDFEQEIEGTRGIPLERVLVASGHRAAESVTVVGLEGERHEFDWASVAEAAWWLRDGSLLIDGESLDVSQIEIVPPDLLNQHEASITDVAPTVATALGLRVPAQATGRVLNVGSADRAVLVFLDAFGYVRYREALADGLLPNIAAVGEPLVAVTTYPPITSVATASLLTGAPPEVHGVAQRGLRRTDTETLFDVAATNGLRVVAIEGESLPFELRNAEWQLSGDLDGNGSSDDNVLANALAVLRSGQPDILFVHFHGIDDAGHTYGPGAAQERPAISEVDSGVGRIIELLSPGTLLVIFADHGMHEVQEEGRLGNHGHLLERDMFIPIFLALK